MRFQLVLATQGRFAFFTTTERLRATVHLLARVVGLRLLLFGVVDEHGHLVVEADDRAAAGHLGSAVQRALAGLGVELGPTFVEEVADAAHLGTLIGYMARQPLKHPIAADPAAWEGTCLADLVGARLGVLEPGALAAMLPRVDVPATALGALGLRGPLCPAAPADAAALWTAVGATFAAYGAAKSDPVRRAAAAYAAVGRGAGLTPGDLRAAAGWSESAWQRAKDLCSPPEDVHAVGMQLALRKLLAENPAGGRRVPATTPQPILRFR